jgi:hypothetical protein
MPTKRPTTGRDSLETYKKTFAANAHFTTTGRECEKNLKGMEGMGHVF